MSPLMATIPSKSYNVNNLTYLEALKTLGLSMVAIETIKNEDLTKK